MFAARARQPTQFPHVDPKWRVGLRFLWLPQWQNRCLATGRVATYNEKMHVTGLGGELACTRLGSTSGSAWPYNLTNGSVSTLIVGRTPVSATAWGEYAAIGIEGGAYYEIINYRSKETGSTLEVQFSSFIGNVTIDFPPNRFFSAAVAQYGASVNTADIAFNGSMLYRGRSVGTASFDSSMYFRVGGSYPEAGYPLHGMTALFAVWQRRIPESELLSLSRNPWQIFLKGMPAYFGEGAPPYIPPSLFARVVRNITG